tara:strand:- start:1413 stop:3110 length:1698 start_codon:yes stop_codon:yes gene_type:complete
MAQGPNPISEDLVTPFEKDRDYTATYDEAISYYLKLQVAYPSSIKVNEFGMTDSGNPLHEIIITKDGVFDPKQIRDDGKAIIFINNAIHPGEPCGVDASMMLARDLRKKRNNLLDHAVVIIIPIYNISGHLNRGSFSRANQQGPRAYGFRGNAQNLDLNRDFIKGDTENSRSFNKLYTKWSPDILIDNHTSNGADYPYVMTLIPTQKDKMEPALSTYMQDKMLPELFLKMKEKGYEMTPYVFARTTPDEGISGFLDLARYSSGYANLHNSISFMPETHMLKPFKDRVMSTYHFMRSMLEHVAENHNNILKARKSAIYNTKTKSEFDLNWEVDIEAVGKLLFKGYEAKYKPSEISGLDRLYYDHDAPYEKEIPFYNTYKSNLVVQKPSAYVIPRVYKQIVDKMKANGVEVIQLDADEILKVEIYKILDYKSPAKPYEGHFLHSKVEVSKSIQNIQYHKGDFLIQTDQKMNCYIIQTLEPQGPDSWFAWNFFDGILMQKEHFSSYVFEDLAAEFLKGNPDVRRALEEKKASDPEFTKSAYAQLNFVYERSPHYEPTFMRYPVGRVLK